MPKQANLYTTAKDRERVPMAIDKLYETFGENKEGEANYRRLADEYGISGSSFIHILADMSRLGVLIRRYTIRTANGKPTGKVSLWRMPYPKDEALRRLNEYFAKTPPMRGKQYKVGGSQPSHAEVADLPTIDDMRAARDGVREKVAVRNNGTEPVEAIAGPDKPGAFEGLRSERKDESGALIEAAKQYADRQNVIKRAFTELEKQGVTVDWSKIGETVKVDPDERLDVVVSVLPYIVTLERQLQRSIDANIDLRDKLKGYDALRKENDALRGQNQRLIAARVGTSAQSAASRSS